MSNKPSLKTITADLLEGGEVIRFKGAWCRVTSVTRKPSTCGTRLDVEINFTDSGGDRCITLPSDHFVAYRPNMQTVAVAARLKAISDLSLLDNAL